VREFVSIILKHQSSDGALQNQEVCKHDSASPFNSKLGLF